MQSSTQIERPATGEQRFQTVFENAAAGVALMSLQGEFTAVNPAFAFLSGYSAADLIGMPFSTLVHTDDYARTTEQVRQLIDGEIQNFWIDKRYVQKSGAVIWSRSNVSLVRGEDGQPPEMLAVVQDITAQRQEAEDTASLDRQITIILESVPNAVYTLDREWRYTYVNSHAEQLMQRARDEVLGHTIWEIFPDLVDTFVYGSFHRALQQQAAVDFELYYPPLSTWFEVHAFPTPDGLAVYFHDINDRKLAEAARQEAESQRRASDERYRLLVEGARDYAMLMTDPDGQITYINPGAERIFGWTESEMVGQNADMIFTREDRARGVATREMERARVASVTDDVRWHLRENGTLFWASGTMRSLYDEAGNLRGFAKVVRDATEQKLAQDELEALHTLNTTVLESIDDAFYAVDQDWCFTYVNSRAARWFELPGEQLIGRSLWTMFPDAKASETYRKLHEAMRDGNAATFESVSLLRGVWLEISAFPMSSGMTIYFRDISERHETQAVQDALLTHEQNIATQLQQALQPPIPADVPGLSIANYYKAALDEAGVGGDFYDIFPLGSGFSAMIVGDLSGKGLAAAAQVATVRNMLRFALYNSDTLAEAVMRLNRTLAENGLLSGFATLFVCTYDADCRILTYVNCAQEPALLVRAFEGGGAPPEELRPTGTVLGSFADSVFEQHRVELQPGDVVAVFTDGLSEAGPNRRSLLDTDGVARLLLNTLPGVELRSQRSDASGSNAAAQIAASLIARVDDYAGEGMRDDVCLLIAVAE